MLCPADGTALTEEAEGLLSCRTCKGRVLSARVFSEIHPTVHEVLRPETDRGSGGFARPRPCPSCRRTMEPLRVDALLAWLDWCGACELLWLERLDVPVVEALKTRLARARAAASFTPEELREAASGIAGETAQDQRDLDVVKTVERLLWALQGW